MGIELVALPLVDIVVELDMEFDAEEEDNPGAEDDVAMDIGADPLAVLVRRLELLDKPNSSSSSWCMLELVLATL